MVFGAMDASTSHWRHSSRRHAESIDDISPDFTSALAPREIKIDAPGIARLVASSSRRPIRVSTGRDCEAARPIEGDHRC